MSTGELANRRDIGDGGMSESGGRPGGGAVATAWDVASKLIAAASATTAAGTQCRLSAEKEINSLSMSIRPTARPSRRDWHPPGAAFQIQPPRTRAPRCRSESLQQANRKRGNRYGDPDRPRTGNPSCSPGKARRKRHPLPPVACPLRRPIVAHAASQPETRRLHAGGRCHLKHGTADRVFASPAALKTDTAWDLGRWEPENYAARSGCHCLGATVLPPSPKGFAHWSVPGGLAVADLDW